MLNTEKVRQAIRTEIDLKSNFLRTNQTNCPIISLVS